jgi:nicotinate phosphoribosyltransferase
VSKFSKFSKLRRMCRAARVLGKSVQVLRRSRNSLALQTDRYEITMIDAALHSGAADRRAVFEVFTRGLPPGRRYGVVAGIDRLIDSIDDFEFLPDDIDYLETLNISPTALEWLASYKFSGDVYGYPEGEVYGAWSPILTVEATFAEAVVLETLILSILNHDAAIASAASRMVTAAAGRRMIEMGSRRTDPDAAVGAARAAAIAGIDATSNLAAGKRYGIETAGTAAHAFTMAHLDEPTAFAAQITAQGVGTTLLVDTYDIASGLHNAVLVARQFGATGPGGVRIDSGDLVAETLAARQTLDALGAYETRIVVSGDLDEFRIDGLVRAGAPIDVFGVGTSLVVGSGAPTAGLTYKLVSIEDAAGVMRGVAKRSPGKAGAAGRKRAERFIDPSNRHLVEQLIVGPDLADSDLQVCYIAHGQRERTSSVNEARARHKEARALLQVVGGLSIEPGEPAIVPNVADLVSTSAILGGVGGA